MTVADVERRLNDGLERSLEERIVARNWLESYMKEKNISVEELDDICFEDSTKIFDSIYGGVI